MQGMIFDIQRFSIHDGPGIRTTVFVKGCSLRCFWCHNPESIHPKRELQIFPAKCIGCGECVKICPTRAHSISGDEKVFNRELCQSCGLCADACFSGSLVMSGRIVDSSDVVEEVLRDREFYTNSGGGVTISGGEPLLQKDFTIEILKSCRAEGIHTAIETAANCGWDDLREALEYTDLVMMDLKHMDSDKHKEATGVPNRRILENAEKIAACGKPIIFRIPVIPTINDSDEEISAISGFVKGLKTQYPDSRISLELLQFHQLAGDKYRSLGIEYKAGSLKPLTKERMAELRNLSESLFSL